MILQALVDLARREGLLSDTSLRMRPVHFQLVISPDGRPLGLIPLGEEGKGLPLKVPAVPKRSVNVAPAFLVDTAEYVLGIAKLRGAASPSEGSIARASKCHEAFVGRVCAAADATEDAGLKAVLSLLDGNEQAPGEAVEKIRAMAADHEWTGDECIAIGVDGDPRTYVHDREAVQVYWAGEYARSGGEGPARRCLVTGELVEPARLHSAIKRIPGAQSSGASLVSFNEPAFCSHGFAQGENAPVSAEAMEGYTRAFNWLLEREGERRFRSGVTLSSDTVMLFWTREGHEITNLLVSLLAPEADRGEDLRAVFEAAWKGLKPRDVDATQFFALTVSGNAARVVVRDWIETTAAEVKDNIRLYFHHLALAGAEGEPLPIARLLTALEAAPGAKRETQGLPPALAGRLARSALCGTPLPREILHLALARLRVPPGEREWRGTLAVRVGLIKATLLRLHPNQEITVALDEANRSIPYLLGRLFAAVEKLQADALDDVNATLRDKYFGSASATPSLVFPRLLRVSAHHASKAEANRRGRAERVKAEIVDLLPAEGAFPKVLDLESQGIFAVGYYHQRQAFFTPRKTEAGSQAD